jgi:hypothetical protein
LPEGTEKNHESLVFNYRLTSPMILFIFHINTVFCIYESTFCSLYNFNISRRMRWAEHVARMGEERNVYKVLMGKPEGKRPLGRPRRRWEDGIRMDLREIGWGSVD